MDIVIAAKLMEVYAACPKCGCEVIGNGKGALECDTAAGIFRRTCSCGWSVEVRENSSEQVPGQALQSIEDPPDENAAEDANEEPHAVMPAPPQSPPDTHTHTHTHRRRP